MDSKTIKTKYDIKLFGLTILSIEKTTINHKGIEVTAPPSPTLKDAFKNGYMGEVRPDLKDLEIKAGLSKPQKKHKLVTCSTCNGMTHDIDIKKCDSCSTEICGNCGSYDDITKKNLCETCWEEL